MKLLRWISALIPALALAQNAAQFPVTMPAAGASGAQQTYMASPDCLGCTAPGAVHATTATSQPTVAGTTDAGNNGYVLSQGAIPSGMAPNMTIGSNGAISAIATALPTIYGPTGSPPYPGIYLYFAQGSLSTTVSTAGYPAGSYWCVMTSTTAGTCYANTYTSGTPQTPASATALSSTGVGAYTQVSTAQNLLSVTLPGGVLGNYGRLEIKVNEVNNNSAGTKTIAVKYGGTGFGSTVPTTGTFVNLDVSITNAGINTVQTGVGVFNSSGTVLTQALQAAPTYANVSSGSSQPINVPCTLNTPATDYCIVISESIKVFQN